MLTGLELRHAALRGGQNIQPRAAQNGNDCRLRRLGIAALVINRHARVADVDHIRGGIVSRHIVLLESRRGDLTAVLIDAVIRAAAGQIAEADRGAIRGYDDRRVGDRANCFAVLGQEGPHLAVCPLDQVALQADQHRCGAGILQRLGHDHSLFVDQAKLTGTSVHADERILVSSVDVVFTVLCVGIEHVDKQLRRLRTRDRRIAGQLHTVAHTGRLRQVNVAVRPNAAGVLVRVAKHTHQDRNGLAVGDGALRLERSVRRSGKQLRLGLPHSKVDVPCRPMARAHIGENGHGAIAHRLASLSDQHYDHLAELGAGKLGIGVELPRAVALDHAEQLQDLHILRRLLVRHIGEAARRRGGDRRCRECQHKREQQGKYSLFHVLSPLIPPAALRPAGAWMP